MNGFGRHRQRLFAAWKYVRLRCVSFIPMRGQKGDLSMANDNRYAKDWNMYSQMWDTQYGAQYENLGDEWNDDYTADRKRDTFYFSAYADRWIRPEMTVLEVGPGGGKWTVLVAPRDKH